MGVGRGVYSTYLVVSILYLPYCYSFPFCFRLFVTNFRCLLFGFLFLFSFFKFCIFVVWWPAFLPKVNMITVWVSFFLTMKKKKSLKYVNASTKRSFGILLQVGNIPAQSVFTNENSLVGIPYGTSREQFLILSWRQHFSVQSSGGITSLLQLNHTALTPVKYQQSNNCHDYRLLRTL